MIGRTNAGGKATETIEAFPYDELFEMDDLSVAGALTATSTVFQDSKVLCQMADVVICKVTGSVSSFGGSWPIGNRVLFRSGPPIYVDYGAAAIRVEIDQTGMLTATLLMFFLNGSYAGKVASGEVSITKLRGYSAPV